MEPQAGQGRRRTLLNATAGTSTKPAQRGRGFAMPAISAVAPPGKAAQAMRGGCGSCVDTGIPSLIEQGWSSGLGLHMGQGQGHGRGQGIDTWRMSRAGEDHGEQRQGHCQRAGQPDDVPQHQPDRAAHDRRQHLSS